MKTSIELPRRLSQLSKASRALVVISNCTGRLVLLLQYRCPISDRGTCCNIADFHFHNVATPKLAVDRQIEKRPVTQSPMLGEIEADGSEHSRFEWALWCQSCCQHFTDDAC
jgi:hypothetical protein